MVPRSRLCDCSANTLSEHLAGRYDRLAREGCTRLYQQGQFHLHSRTTMASTAANATDDLGNLKWSVSLGILLFLATIYAILRRLGV